MPSSKRFVTVVVLASWAYVRPGCVEKQTRAATIPQTRGLTEKWRTLSALCLTFTGAHSIRHEHWSRQISGHQRQFSEIRDGARKAPEHGRIPARLEHSGQR